QGVQHMTDPRAALSEMGRVLKPGGRLALAAWTRSPFQLFREIVARFAPGAGHPSEFGKDPAELADALRATGFREVQVQTRLMRHPFEHVDEALLLAQGTSTGPLIAAMSPAEQQAVRAALTEAVEGLISDGLVYLSSETN